MIKAVKVGWRNKPQNDPRINVIDTLLSRNEISALIESHHVFLSLHRSEGLGLGCAEALAAGNAVIATDYGGSAEFIGTSTGFPVTWSPVQVGSEDYVLSGDSTWAEPSVGHATELLRSIYENPTNASTGPCEKKCSTRNGSTPPNKLRSQSMLGSGNTTKSDLTMPWE